MFYRLDADDLSEVLAKARAQYPKDDAEVQHSLRLSKGELSFKEEAITNDFSIGEGFYRFNEDIHYTGWGNAPLLEMQFNLSPKTILYKNTVSANELIPPMTGNIIFDAENAKSEISFHKHINYQTFDIHLPLRMLLQFQGECAVIDHFLELVIHQKSSLFSNHPIAINPQIWSLIQDIKQCRYTGLTRRIYLEGKVYELIALSYDSMLHTAKETIRLSDYDRDCIYRAEELIRSKLDHPFTIPELSAQVGINQTKLKYGFKQLFGRGVFEYMQQLRMEQARNLLLNTDKPVYNISLLCGYNSMSNFSTAFKRCFGYPPSVLRK
jgi:AraC-like DNA-binding protein